MNRPIPEKPVPPPEPDDVPLAPSIGQILSEHLEEIVGPETTAKLRKAKEGAE